jgi:hypothetical protein
MIGTPDVFFLQDFASPYHDYELPLPFGLACGDHPK